MGIKCEIRGKYAGAKIHLEPAECQLLMKLAKSPTPSLFKQAGELANKIGVKLNKLLVEHPNFLKERTQAEIQHELEVEFQSAKEKISALKSGGNWQSIHIK